MYWIKATVPFALLSGISPMLVLPYQGTLDEPGPSRPQRFFRPTRGSRLGGQGPGVERIEQSAERQDNESLVHPLVQPGQPGWIMLCLFQP
jgi:hypothetical protein